jgi:cytochrome P450
MARGRNKTPAERALEVICTMAGVPFDEFQQQLEKSQGDKANPRTFPESSYNMVKNNYFKNSSINQQEWKDLYQHITNPKSNFGN